MNIAIGDSSVGYQIHISGFQGNASDAMTVNEGGIFVVSYAFYVGGFWIIGGCDITAGINLVSSSDDFAWASPFSYFHLASTELWLYC